jgi:hypothetical protein
MFARMGLIRAPLPTPIIEFVNAFAFRHHKLGAFRGFPLHASFQIANWLSCQ